MIVLECIGLVLLVVPLILSRTSLTPEYTVLFIFVITTIDEMELRSFFVATNLPSPLLNHSLPF